MSNQTANQTNPLIPYLKQQGAVKAQLVNGPNGDFVSATKADGSRFTLPVGRKSQGSTLKEMNVLITDDGVAIATANNYSVADSMDL